MFELGGIAIAEATWAKIPYFSRVDRYIECWHCGGIVVWAVPKTVTDHVSHARERARQYVAVLSPRLVEVSERRICLCIQWAARNIGEVFPNRGVISIGHPVYTRNGIRVSCWSATVDANEPWKYQPGRYVGLKLGMNDVHEVIHGNISNGISPQITQ